MVDVGAGSGILSVFAVQAGARKVYAIEASSMAVHCQKLIKSNKLASKIIVIAGKVEEVSYLYVYCISGFFTRELYFAKCTKFPILGF